METTFRTEDTERDERFAYWREAICDAYVHLGCEMLEPGDFSGEIVLRDVESVSVSQVSSSPQHVIRRPKDISRACDDFFLLSLQLSGTGRVVQHRREALLRPGDFALYSSSDPYELIFPEYFRQIVVQIPKADLAETLPIADMITAIAVDSRRKRGRQISGALAALAAGTMADWAADNTGRAEAIIDLISSGLASLAEGTRCRLKRQDRLTVLRIEAYIASNLKDPDLSRTQVAAGMGMSVRRINELLAAKQSSITDRIREARLAQIAGELRDPANARERISDLAGKWGFRNMQHFSRLFVSRYGMPARDYRNAKLSAVRHH